MSPPAFFHYTKHVHAKQCPAQPILLITVNNYFSRVGPSVIFMSHNSCTAASTYSSTLHHAHICFSFATISRNALHFLFGF
jgi:hypothetical protein